jgi:hypothetical protein
MVTDATIIGGGGHMMGKHYRASGVEARHPPYEEQF